MNRANFDQGADDLVPGEEAVKSRYPRPRHITAVAPASAHATIVATRRQATAIRRTSSTNVSSRATTVGYHPAAISRRSRAYARLAPPPTGNPPLELRRRTCVGEQRISGKMGGRNEHSRTAVELRTKRPARRFGGVGGRQRPRTGEIASSPNSKCPSNGFRMRAPRPTSLRLRRSTSQAGTKMAGQHHHWPLPG